MIDFSELEDIYLNTGDTDDDTTLEIKRRIWTLTPAERNIMLLYIHCGTYTGVARTLKSSPPTAKSRITAIKNKLKI